MTAPIIETPRGRVIADKASMKATMEWNKEFANVRQKRYTMAQKFVDSEILRLSQVYIPMDTGMLIMSGILGTDVGSGEVQWIAPYARAQYFMAREIGSQHGPLRGPYWFHRMKDVYGQRIISKAKILAGRGSL